MDNVDNYLSRLSFGFEKVLSNHENVLDERLEETKGVNAPIVTRDSLANRVNAGLWGSLTPEEQNLWLYG